MRPTAGSTMTCGCPACSSTSSTRPTSTRACCCALPVLDDRRGGGGRAGTYGAGPVPARRAHRSAVASTTRCFTMFAVAGSSPSPRPTSPRRDGPDLACAAVIGVGRRVCPSGYAPRRSATGSASTARSCSTPGGARRPRVRPAGGTVRRRWNVPDWPLQLVVAGPGAGVDLPTRARPFVIDVGVLSETRS